MIIGVKSIIKIVNPIETKTVVILRLELEFQLASWGNLNFITIKGIN